MIDGAVDAKPVMKRFDREPGGKSKHEHPGDELRQHGLLPSGTVVGPTTIGQPMCTRRATGTRRKIRTLSGGIARRGGGAPLISRVLRPVPAERPTTAARREVSPASHAAGGVTSQAVQEIDARRYWGSSVTWTRVENPLGSVAKFALYGENPGATMAIECGPGAIGRARASRSRAVPSGRPSI